MYDGGSSAYIFTKKRTPSEENFNNYARILITSMLYRGTTLEAYLEHSHRSTMEAVQPTYLLKTGLLQRKTLTIKLEF